MTPNPQSEHTLYPLKDPHTPEFGPLVVAHTSHSTVIQPSICS